MTHDDAFLQDILANPEDDTPRLIYADWLEERGDPRGEFIRVQCRLARMSADDKRRPRLEQLEGELLERYQDKWLGSVRPSLARWSFRRGFLDMIAVPASLYLQRAVKCPATVRRFEVDLAGFEIPLSIIELVPEGVARESVTIPLGLHNRTLVMAMPDPRDTELLAKLQFIMNRYIEPVAASREQIIETIGRHYGGLEVESVNTICFADVQLDFDWYEARDGSPVARLVDLIIAEAMNLNATAIRIDPEPDRLCVRYQLAGQWVDRDWPPRRLLDPIVARISFLSGINISREEPEQTWRMRGTSWGRSFDLAVLVRRTKEGPGLLLTFMQLESGGGAAPTA
jgi:uncharacterized protein (TIGR02996 family)